MLCLKRNDIGLTGIKELQAALTNTKTIRILDVAGNNITDEGVKIIVTALSNKQKQQLHTIILADNKLTSKGAQFVCSLMDQCPTL